MTNEELQRLAAELNRHAQAGEIEAFIGNEWVRQKFSNTYRFLDGLRIKPKPREVWIHRSDIHSLRTNGTAICSVPLPEQVSPNGYIKFREVLDD